MSSSVPDPKFIKYLFDPARLYDCYVLVGNPKIEPPEKMGVVKDMLFAHSTVMRTDLQVTNMKEKEPVKIVDIFPHTFRNLLRYVYGHDTTETLSFDDADNLLYAAEKYIITDLKDKVATRLMLLLNTDNICSLLNNPACYQALELNAMITKILRTETNKVFENPNFLELTSEAFVNILEQDSLKVREIEIWRSAIKWAKHRANSENGKNLRAELIQPLKHIRLCSLSPEEFCKEVAPTEVLHSEESVFVSISVGSRQKQPKLTEICNELEPRRGIPEKSSLIHKVWGLTGKKSASECVFTIKTKDSAVEMLSMTVVAEYQRLNNGLQFDFTVDVKQEDKPQMVTRVTFTGHNLYGDVTIPISTPDREVLLLSNKEYTVKVYCDKRFTDHETITSQPGNEHFTLTYKPNRYADLRQCVKRLDYKTVTP